ncbi:uncharacterized protein LOC123668010 [Melitaea cinxia]|uniref:uncharacterized protein LOC123668010 n=1 Tax=Melitaea cinxia TaxID=113334 RepID=UPI001E270BD4|nr:uncharacterized protein LOC123668010 [Melitaea cinxia]
MRRTVFVCILLSQILAASPWRSDPGRFTCHSYSHPLFCSTSWSTRHPCYSPASSSCGVRVKPFLNLLIDDPPLKLDTYTPDLFEVTEKTSKILHKLHTVAEDFEQVAEEYIQIHTSINETSEEEQAEYDDDEVTRCIDDEIDIRDAEDDSCEEDVVNTSTEDDDCSDVSGEQHDVDQPVLDIEIRIRSKI